jgi:hypothetical protein
MELEGIIKNIISFLTMLGVYHRYMISLLDRTNERFERELNKKINLEEWEREKELFLKLQSNNTKSLVEALERIDKRIGRIEEKLMNI